MSEKTEAIDALDARLTRVERHMSPFLYAARQQASEGEGGTVFRFSGEDVERVLSETRLAPMEAKGAKVEILFNGCRRVILVNGHRIPKVLDIETPRHRGSIAGTVKVSLMASEIVERGVSREEFDALLRGDGLAKG